nr:hypothetical protein BaRGS_007257 [Batillaria attramentaria]
MGVKQGPGFTMKNRGTKYQKCLKKCGAAEDFVKAQLAKVETLRQNLDDIYQSTKSQRENDPENGASPNLTYVDDAFAQICTDLEKLKDEPAEKGKGERKSKKLKIKLLFSSKIVGCDRGADGIIDQDTM